MQSRRLEGYVRKEYALLYTICESPKAVITRYLQMGASIEIANFEGDGRICECDFNILLREISNLDFKGVSGFVSMGGYA